MNSIYSTVEHLTRVAKIDRNTLLDMSEGELNLVLLQTNNRIEEENEVMKKINRGI